MQSFFALSRILEHHILHVCFHSSMFNSSSNYNISIISRFRTSEHCANLPSLFIFYHYRGDAIIYTFVIQNSKKDLLKWTSMKGNVLKMKIPNIPFCEASHQNSMIEFEIAFSS